MNHGLAIPGEDAGIAQGQGSRTHGIAQADAVENAKRIRPQADPGAYFAQLAGPLVHLDLETRATHRDRRSDAPDSSADHDRSHGLIAPRGSAVRAAARRDWQRGQKNVERWPWTIRRIGVPQMRHGSRARS